jgi:hypothetical protein
MPKASQRQFLITVDGVEGYFATKSGGDVSSDISTVWDGGSLTPEKLPAPAVVGDVTVGRPYDPNRDGAELAKLKPLVGRWRTTVGIQPTDADLIASGPPTVYANALLSGLTDPEADAGSGDAATFELTFAIETVA